MNYLDRGVSRMAALLVAVISIGSCSSPRPAPSPALVSTTNAPALWGEMKPIVSVKELMRDMIDPVADNIFDAVAIVRDGNGTVERTPRTEEDWEKIRVGATSLAEGSYLLKVPRAFAPAGDANNSIGPGAVELSPSQITAKVEKDLVEWNARIESLRNVGLEVLEIVKRKDAKELWNAAEDLDTACESCHRSYWYPGETPEFYRRLDRSLTQSRHLAGKKSVADGVKVE